MTGRVWKSIHPGVCAHTRAAGIHSSDVRALFMPMDCISSLQNWLQALNYWDMWYAVASHQLNHVPLMCRYRQQFDGTLCEPILIQSGVLSDAIKNSITQIGFVLWIRPLIANYCGIVWDYNIYFEKKSTCMFACDKTMQNFFIIEWRAFSTIV